MNNNLAGIFTFFIPNKTARHRARGFLEYGLIRAAKVYFKKTNQKPKYNLAICAIAKNEGRYFKEWIEYHKMLGVEKFYIYDNESEDNTREILQPFVDNGLVEYTYIPGKKKQLISYEDCLNKHRFDAKWIAFIDLDEFIVPKKHKTIPEFLSGFKDFSVVEINWVCFGSGGQKKRTNDLVIERFRDRAEYNNRLNRHIKSIVQPTKVLFFLGAHEALRLSGKACDVNKKPVTEYFKDREPVGQNIICVNHYAVKSYEEFLEKHNRGSARFGIQRNISYFDKFDLNDVKNDMVMDKYIPTVRKLLKN